MTEHCLIFTADVDNKSCATIVGYLNELVRLRATKLTVAISSKGGSVNSGITIYNLLRSMPFDVVTHNIGNVDSIANAIYLAGDRRLTNGSSRFLFHGVSVSFPPNHRLDAKSLKETLQSVQTDNDRIARVIADRSTIDLKRSRKLFTEQTTRDPSWAIANGISHGVAEFVIPNGAEVKHLIST